MSVFALLLGAAAIGGPLGTLAVLARRRWWRGLPAADAGDSPRRPVAFTIAAIALAAKMARADGEASAAEFDAFERLFHVEVAERPNVERFWRLARGSTAGFEAYADQAAALLGPGSAALEDLFDALLAIASIDGFAGPEDEFLDEVARRFGFDAATAARLRARCRLCPQSDAHAVLGLTPDATPEAIRAAYRALAREHHPDRHLADGVPSAFIRVAEERMAAINAAYATLTRPGGRV